MNNNFLYYNKINVNGNPNDKIIYNNDTGICLNKCVSDNNCQGVTISNPQCGKNMTFSECIGLFTDIDILNTNPENLYKPKCKFLSNVENSNQVYFTEENKSYIKNKYGNMLNFKIDTSKYYYLKINEKYLGVNNELNSLFLIFVNSLNDASLFKFNSDGNIIELKSSKCLQTNGNYIILADCDNNLITQNFIYENKFNSIRPINFIQDNKMFCIDVGENNETGGRIKLVECNYSATQTVYAELKEYEKHEKQKKIDEQNEQLYENFKSFRKQIENKMDDVNFCSDPVYKTIVFIVLVLILIYFIWFITRKQYSDDIDIRELVSTPFAK